MELKIPCMVIKYIASTMVSIRPKGPFWGTCMDITSLGSIMVSVRPKDAFGGTCMVFKFLTGSVALIHPIAHS